MIRFNPSAAGCGDGRTVSRYFSWAPPTPPRRHCSPACRWPRSLKAASTLDTCAARSAAPPPKFGAACQSTSYELSRDRLVRSERRWETAAACGAVRCRRHCCLCTRAGAPPPPTACTGLRTAALHFIKTFFQHSAISFPPSWLCHAWTKQQGAAAIPGTWE